jgi:hypothetical protein
MYHLIAIMHTDSTTEICNSLRLTHFFFFFAARNQMLIDPLYSDLHHKYLL